MSYRVEFGGGAQVQFQSGVARRRVSTRRQECSHAGLSRIRHGQRGCRADLHRPVAGHWERKSELVSGKTPGFGGALQVFGLVSGVARWRALGAQLGGLCSRRVGRASRSGDRDSWPRRRRPAPSPTPAAELKVATRQRNCAARKAPIFSASIVESRPWRLGAPTRVTCDARSGQLWPKVMADIGQTRGLGPSLTVDPGCDGLNHARGWLVGALVCHR